MSDHEYSQGIMTGEGAVVLKNGIPLSIDEIVMELNELQAARQAPASGEVEPVAYLVECDGLRWAHAEHKDAEVQAMRLGADVTELFAHPPAKVPEGWKLVPIESTSDMDIAGMDSLYSSYEGYIIDRDAAEVIWNAMVGAAPAPPREQ